MYIERMAISKQGAKFGQKFDHNHTFIPAVIIVDEYTSKLAPQQGNRARSN
jgi:hypothetical protein